MSYLNAVSAAIVSALQGNASLVALLASPTSVYKLIAPDNAEYDFVIFNHQGGGPENISSADLEDNVWAVKAYSKTSAKQATLIFNAFDTILHKKNLSIAGGTTIQCVREQNIESVETPPNERKVWMVGGFYRIRTTGV